VPLFLTELEGKCSWGNIPADLLASSLANCVSLSLGDTVDLFSTVTMTPSFLEVYYIEHLPIALEFKICCS
jgi:hypothetical protein